ncbi:IS903D transposase [Neochlamydia sp. EPS4]|nr:IS903D transposase [Neochlamydia sp. EPS4]
MQQQKYRQVMDKKFNYCIGNCSEYNKALVQRGSITLWFSNEAIKGWRENKSTGKKGLAQELTLMTLSYAY